MPRVRADCVGGPRPCPFVACRHHLLLEIHSTTGRLMVNTSQALWEMAETCSLDVADRGGVTLQELGDLWDLSRERIRQIERGALAKLRRAVEGGQHDLEAVG